MVGCHARKFLKAARADGVEPSRLLGGKPCSVILRQNKQEIFSFECTKVYLVEKNLVASVGRHAEDLRGNDTKNVPFYASGHTKREDCLLFVFCFWLFFFVVVFKRFLLFFRKVRHQQDSGTMS